MKFTDLLLLILVVLLVSLPVIIVGIAASGHKKTDCGREYYELKGQPLPDLVDVAVAKGLCK